MRSVHSCSGWYPKHSLICAKAPFWSSAEAYARQAPLPDKKWSQRLKNSYLQIQPPTFKKFTCHLQKRIFKVTTGSQQPLLFHLQLFHLQPFHSQPPPYLLLLHHLSQPAGIWVQGGKRQRGRKQEGDGR